MTVTLNNKWVRAGIELAAVVAGLLILSAWSERTELGALVLSNVRQIMGVEESR